MSTADEKAVATTLGLILDELQTRPKGEGQFLRDAVRGIGDMLGSTGGMGAMARVLSLVTDSAPESVADFREDTIDPLWNGIDGWGS